MSRLRANLVQAIVAILMLVTLLVYVMGAVLALRTLRHPFVGALVEPTLVVNNVDESDWQGHAAGLAFLDRLVALDGQALTRPHALYEVLTRYEVGDTVALTVVDQSGQRREVSVTLQSFPTSAVVGFFVIPYAIGLVYLLLGLVVFVARRDKAAGRAFPLFCMAFALVVGLLFDLYTTHRLMHLWVVGAAILGGTMIDLALVFPKRSSLSLRWPWLSWMVYVPCWVLGTRAMVITLDMNDPWAYIATWRYLYAYMALGALLWWAMLLRRRLRAELPMVRDQARIVLLGVLVAFLPALIWFVLAVLQVGRNVRPMVMFVPLIVLPLSIAYAILRYRLLDVDFLISRSVSYGLLTLLIVGGYLLIVNLLGLLLGSTVVADDPLTIALFVFVVTLAFNPLRTRLQRSVDRLFLRERINYRQALEQYSHDLGRLLTQPDIFSALSRRVEDAVHPERLMFYLYNEQALQFVPVSDSQGRCSGVCFAPDGGLATLVTERGRSLYLMQGQPLPPELEGEAEQLRVLGASLFLPFAGQGWMALGEKRSGEPYATDDLDYLEALADQTSLALERVQLVSDLERRVNELDALRWIGQAVNFSVSLDDLMELIYTQSGRVLDTSNFYIALYDQVKKTMSYAFYVEEGERYYPEDEWPLGWGLVSEVVQKGQPIVTESYADECARRGVTPLIKSAAAWMGVALKIGESVVGAMCVSSPAPGSSYGPEQLNIFSAIAGQASAILEKTQLYDEMQERTQQLVTLNEVGRAINSTLDLQTVLDLITEKAASILEAEAGSLFLTDLNTDELVFQVAVGPTAEDLVGLRLPPGTGIVGAVAQTQETIIVNNAQKDQRWFSGTDKTAGFVTRALLAVPLISQDKSIGVLEVINKQDGTPFDQQDEQLILTFASQAAVAIENARLFTQTDQALAARVKELSMFQEVDHALNATLDFQRVIELTLDWAMRMTDAQTGSVATLDEEAGGLLLVASWGYPPEYERYREKPWSVSQGIVGRVVRTAKPVVMDDVREDPDYVMAVPETRSQLSVPICMGDDVVGVINLESPETAGFSQDDLHFATRLADRAVVPIENALLYEQIKKANDAKSQFVSVVAHELKIPMTSIKGYARLLELSQGPIDETKRGFIKTISSNVDRMNKMVSDLLDISRIETGRLKLDMEALALSSVIDEAVDALRGAIQDKELALELDDVDDLPTVWGDRTRLTQVLINLLSNAVKYTIEGSISIHAQVVEQPDPEDGHVRRFVCCAVQDTGIGISEEDQERLFKSQFVRFENAVDVAPGHGLGLWLVNRLVEMQDGQITFESELGQGSTFAFTVPVAGAALTGETE